MLRSISGASARSMSRVAAVLVALPLLLVVVILGSAPAASAHNTLISSDPKAGETVAQPPAQIILTFNDDILDVGAAVKMTGPAGSVAVDAPTVEGPRLVQQLPDGLPAGGYEVVWRVTSADGHPIDGTLRFTASAGAAPATTAAPAPTSSAAGAPSASSATATTQAAPTPSPSVTAAGSTGGDGGIPAWVWIVAAVGVIGAGAVAFAAARRSRDQNPG
jgi:methionine-rich copper-binding protein CopC